MSRILAGRSLGILGGGQLARMLALRAHDLGIEARVFCENASDPAAQVVRHWSPGSLNDPAQLEAFLRTCDVVTFESEFLDAALLARLQKRAGCAIYPRPAHMAVVQDRLSQKRLLARHRIPTAAFLPVSSFGQARAAWERFAPGGGMVLKKRRFGYDGYGTFIVRSREELEALRLDVESSEHGFIAERLVRFRREAALMIVRGRKGPAATFPLVETRQEAARCLWVRGPLRLPAAKALARKLARFVECIGYVGAMGVELFDAAEGLMVNELAPRVHNSGHYSLDALEEDQFTAHVKATMGLPVAPPRALAAGFAMLNLLGEDRRERPANRAKRAGRALGKPASPCWPISPGVALHWYGKLESRPGRKMGHLNALGTTPNSALRRLLAARKGLSV
jgi:5-(carboxyamino)imidazole ribonucleotide synthase